MRQAWREFTSEGSVVDRAAVRLASTPATSMSTPASARTGAISSRWLNRSSICAAFTLWSVALPTTLMMVSPTAGYDNVRRTRHGQQFRQPLHDGKDDDLQQRHALSLSTSDRSSQRSISPSSGSRSRGPRRRPHDPRASNVPIL